MSTATKLSPESVRTMDDASIAQLLAKLDGDGVKWKIAARVDKYDRAAIQRARDFFELRPDQEPIGWQLAAVAAPYETVVEEGNLLTRLGKKRLIDRFVETASNVGIKVTTGRIGTGNSATAAVDTDTDLGAAAGSANRQFQMLDSAPTVGTGASSGVVTLVSTFGTGVGNYAWAEWGVDGGTAAGTTVTADTNTTPGLINHKITALGTKTSAATWVLTVTITIT